MNILYIEDLKNWRKLFSDRLRSYYNINVMTEADEAENFIIQNVSDIDIVITNLNLSDFCLDGGGKKILSLIQDNYPFLPRIVLTEDPDGSTAILFDEYDVDDVLIKTKTLSIERLKDLIENAIKKRQNKSKQKPNIVSEDFWSVESCGMLHTIEEGVYRDIIAGLSPERMDELFHKLQSYREPLWTILSRPQDDTSYRYTIDFLRNLWTQEKGLPPFDMIQLLAKKQFNSDELYSGYRDHLVHSLIVYLLGLHLYYSNRKIREAIRLVHKESEFLTAWKIAALFHDVGYCLNMGEEANAEIKKILLHRIEEFSENPLKLYIEANEKMGLKLAEADERRMRGVATPPRWELSTIEDLRIPLGAASGHILDIIDHLIKDTNLADHSEARYCYRYDRYAESTDTDNHPACLDHGMVSAMILLGGYKYFRKYVESTCAEKVLVSIKGLSDPLKECLTNLANLVNGYEESIKHAAAAIAVHNSHVTGWTKQDSDWAKARSEPYFLTLDQYKLSLQKTPLAWLLALTDVLQCWDRPNWTEAPESLKDCTLKNQQVRIKAELEKIVVTFTTDEFKNTSESRFNRLIKDLNKYMDNMELLEEG